MRIVGIVAALAALALASPAEARHHHHHARTHAGHSYAVDPGCNVLWPCEGVSASPRGSRIARELNFGSPVQRYSPDPVRKAPRRAISARRQAFAYEPPRTPGEGPGASVGRLPGIVPALAAKVGQIVRDCGSRVISTVRHTLVRGTRVLSLHASGRAVDVSGNPSCIYGELRGWPGGYSTDYSSVRHVHISLGGREDGIRFVHGGRHHGHRHHRRHR
jgi:hypothetical protein